MVYCPVGKQHRNYFSVYTCSSTCIKNLHRNNGVINLSAHQKQTTDTFNSFVDILHFKKCAHCISISQCYKIAKILFFENLGFWAPLVKLFRTLSSTAPMRSHWTFWRRPLSGATLLQLPPILLVRELELLLTLYQGHMEIDEVNGCCKSQFVAIFLNI